MTLKIESRTINGFEMVAVMLGTTVLAAAWSEAGARTKAAELIKKAKGN